ncbi:glucose 1-dehydrogenase [Aurantimonas sp. C2-6-R+9]|uniref:glucose 1-dehydrogenase n=1 Tax=unclassified Aurantimonas TaxID=2638230 RepID=UPI002E17B1FF|nr:MULTISPECIES: glucose 1-dehydrogenase [unclassified Aurantimonas]MEC5290170.1 glucose 1-dehydrogenase [Aurantimonas sp. C2-3-R2]MEC5324723.1 glucose 1-dehydrogenase [Aurantimonas sp. A3-2-R12]MEC5380283.1 glucose 1-dehydrogenase [Aurantimonas sp. C2-6-R+9]MEC5411234.1 glucose 1-dehydrogenase [Aurantimonas sp. C2-4-R8]
MRLANKRALVTGGGSGFGEGIARAFAKEGAKVAVLDINEAGARRVAGELGDGHVAIPCDLTDGQAVEAAWKTATDALGGIDIVVNNAGWTHRNKPILEVTEEEFDKVYAVNVKAIFHMTRTCVPAMRDAGGGVIINIGSTAGLRPRPGLTWYNSSKGAVNTLTKSLAVELAPMKIRVCGIAPVIGETGLLSEFMGVPDTPENRAKFIATIPLGRMSRPEDIANATVFLSSDEAAMITGAVLEVDGGRCI